MIIRKLFKFEASHIVRNCSTSRCSRSLHGHSYVVEVFLHSRKLDNAHMAMDFSLFKPIISDLIDSFDHSYVMWDKEPEEFRGFMKSNSERWIEMPMNPSAESFAILFYDFIERLMKGFDFANGESVHLDSVRVHETVTGYAEANALDVIMIPDFTNYNPFYNIVFSQGIKKDWKEPQVMMGLKRYKFPEVIQQIK